MTEPGLNPLPDLYILYTYEAVGSETGCRAYVYADKTVATAAGETLKAQQPAEVTSFSYMVLPLEGPTSSQ